jgi:hypothetical protein
MKSTGKPVHIESSAVKWTQPCETECNHLSAWRSWLLYQPGRNRAETKPRPVIRRRSRKRKRSEVLLATLEAARAISAQELPAESAARQLALREGLWTGKIGKGVGRAFKKLF